MIGCREAKVYHEELIDDRKSEDMNIGEEDNAKLFAKWNLVEKKQLSGSAPAYQQMLRDRKLI